MSVLHTDEGESTAEWALRKPGFLGTINQLTCCGRCGGPLEPGRDKKRRVFGLFTPSMHFVCDKCFFQLPE